MAIRLLDDGGTPVTMTNLDRPGAATECKAGGIAPAAFKVSAHQTEQTEIIMYRVGQI